MKYTGTYITMKGYNYHRVLELAKKNSPALSPMTRVQNALSSLDFCTNRRIFESLVQAIES